MNDIAQLQAQLNQLTSELSFAQERIQKLERSNKWKPAFFIGLAVVVASGLGSWSVSASSSGKASLASSPLVAPPTKMQAPFEVVDDQGKTILLVQDREVTGLPRGAYIYSKTGKPVVDLSATTLDGGGGRVRTTSDDEQNCTVMVGTNNVIALSTYKSEKRTTMIGTDQGNPAIVKLYRDDGQKTAAAIELKEGRGALNVYGTGDKPVASLQSDAGDGKLWINDKDGQPVAGVFANDNGGVVKVMKSGDPTTYAGLNAVNAGLGLAIRKAGVRLVFAGASGESEEKGSVFVYGGGEYPIAGVTSYGGGKGLIAIFNPTLRPIAMLAESAEHPGGGNITASAPNGNGIFSAGFTGEAGDACVTRKNGLWCMGTNLPLQMK
jgi:hypothetical protein